MPSDEEAALAAVAHLEEALEHATRAQRHAHLIDLGRALGGIIGVVDAQAVDLGKTEAAEARTERPVRTIRGEVIENAIVIVCE